MASRDSVMFLERLLAGFVAYVSRCLAEHMESSEYPNAYF